MARYARILCELQLAAQMARKNETTIVLDGTLTVPPPLTIKKTMEETIEASERNRNSLVGVSKDSEVALFGGLIGDEQMLQLVKREGLLYTLPPQPRKTTLGPQGTTYFVRYL